MTVPHPFRPQGNGHGEYRSDATERGVLPNAARQVHVDIDEFVLTGFSRSEGQAIADHVRTALEHLFAGDVTRWSRSEPMDVDSLDAGRVRIRRAGHPQGTGERVARAIYGSLPK